MKKDIETLKKDQSEMKNAISEIDNTLEVVNSRLDEAEDQTNDLEAMVEKKHPGRGAKRKKELKKNEQGLRNILDIMKHNNIRIMGIPEGEESKQAI